MITKRTDLTPNQKYTWIDCREIDKEDVSILTDEYLISSELLADIMDADEQSRIEKEDEYTVIICRLPSAEEDDDKPLERTTIPLGMVLYPDKIITICRGDSVVIDDFARRRFRQCPVETKEGFVLSILGRAALDYIRFLKYINRQKDLVEEQLHQSIMNYELIQLLQIQKSLVYLTTGLTDNEVLLEKLQKTPYFRLSTDEELEFLEDIITDNKHDGCVCFCYRKQYERNHETPYDNFSFPDVSYIYHGLFRNECDNSWYGRKVGVAVPSCALRDCGSGRDYCRIRQEKSFCD